MASRTQKIPAVLSIAGSDNSGGAGIQADLKTFTTMGVYGTTAVTCVVSEHPGKVSAIEAVSSKHVLSQIELVHEAFPVAAAKTGMLYSKQIIQAVASYWKSLTPRKRPPLVVDPVMVATSGAMLLKPSALKAILGELLPLAALVTPNLDETSVLLGREILDELELEQAARDCYEKFGVPFLVKGGHLHERKGGGRAKPLRESVDVLFDGKTARYYKAPTVPKVKTHGTGCTFSAAICAGLAKGLSLEASVEVGKRFITRAIEHHFTLGKYTPLTHLPDKSFE